jgi:hypothetical protein
VKTDFQIRNCGARTTKQVVRGHPPRGRSGVHSWADAPPCCVPC